MKKKSLLLVSSCLVVCAVLNAENLRVEVNNRYSDDTLFGKDALDRMIALHGTCIKKASPSYCEDQLKLKKNQLEIQTVNGLIGALDEVETFLQPQSVEKSSEEMRKQDQKVDLRHAVTIIKYVMELEESAQDLFNKALPLVKKRTYGYLYRDLGNATTLIWSEHLAKQVFYHPSFKHLKPKAQQDVVLALNKRFTEYFRSFVRQNARNEVQAKSDFAFFYQAIPNLMIKVLKPFYPTLDRSMIYNK